MARTTRFLAFLALAAGPVGAANAEPCYTLVTEAQRAQLAGRLSAERVVNRIRLGRRDLRWNGTAITPAALRQFLSITTTMNPKPLLIVAVEPGADARLVAELRRLIGATLHCAPGAFDVARH